MSRDQFSSVALRLHRYLVDQHWQSGALRGPDPGIRVNYRLGRFVKSYLPQLRWGDDYYYLQGQGYWILANWTLFDRTGDETYRGIAQLGAQQVLSNQREDGCWDYPNPEWKGRVATVEGIWGSLGLLETYRRTGDRALLAGAERWHDYLVGTIGFQRVGDELAVNYFANQPSSRVPNNSADMLRFIATLTYVTGRQEYLEPATGLLTFISRAQKPSGEFHYAVAGAPGVRTRAHFQCYQYNAFQALGLMRYLEFTRDQRALPLIERVLEFLRGGVAADGHAYYDCDNRERAVTYHAAALAAAFAQARQAGLTGYEVLEQRAYAYVLREQQADGGFTYSRRDYRLLSDRRSYPRYLAMILYHLLLRETPSAARGLGRAPLLDQAL